MALGIGAVLILGAVALFYYDSTIGIDKGDATADAFISYSVEQAAASHVTVIVIPQGAAQPPPDFNVTELLTHNYAYPVNITVVVGVNNTIEWLNHDGTDHTVESFSVPANATGFSSGLIGTNQTYDATLTVPGVYKYTCIWHPWLAGEITVVGTA